MKSVAFGDSDFHAMLDRRWLSVRAQAAERRMGWAYTDAHHYALCVVLDQFGYHYRYCYKHFTDAFEALFAWDGEGDPPGPWIVRKGDGPDRQGPAGSKFHDEG